MQNSVDLDPVLESGLRIEQPPQKLREIALDRIRDAIISGHFPAGERLVERSLCEQVGVSRSVVREVIRILETEGFVVTGPRGPEVSKLDWEQAAQIYEIRRMLERSAAEACAQKANAAVLAQLKAAHERLQAAISAGAARPIYLETAEFYRIIFETAGHPIAWEIVQRLNGRISRLRVLTVREAHREVSGAERIARIYRAIMAGDAPAAGAAVEVHVREAAALARRLLSQTQL